MKCGRCCGALRYAIMGSSLSCDRRPSEVYENGALARAVDRSLEIKCMRMRAFINKHRDSLHLHIAQLRQFASSPG
ncbi:unnamed protein product, partial [Toxocara canis]|uniref:LOB domain-containing protein n=1 Tax=Toxocara canis TaxID=6265 RepID=A0A183U556_TOXCA